MPDNSWPETADAEAQIASAEDAAEPAPAIVDQYMKAVDLSRNIEAPHGVVQGRLAKLKQAMANRAAWHGEGWSERIDTRYAFQVVRSWLAIIVITAGAESADGYSRLVGDDVDQLAEHVVSRAENGFRDSLGRIHWW